mmetsp:Transcript_43356/g.101507  ORF Transcript_43356/g.101507 Transcript_43356/m.101507 type:complete len:201 (+) Transcript_43356:170-772(+)
MPTASRWRARARAARSSFFFVLDFFLAAASALPLARRAGGASVLGEAAPAAARPGARGSESTRLLAPPASASVCGAPSAAPSPQQLDADNWPPSHSSCEVASPRHSWLPSLPWHSPSKRSVRSSPSVSTGSKRRLRKYSIAEATSWPHSSSADLASSEAVPSQQRITVLTSTSAPLSFEQSPIGSGALCAPSAVSGRTEL